MAKAPPLVVANAAQLTVFFAIGTSTAMVNVYGVHAIPGTPISQAVADSVGSAVAAAWTTNIAPHAHPTVAMGIVGLRDLRQANLPRFDHNVSGVTGTAPTADLLPAEVALVITLRTALSGRSFRGRTYLGGFTEAENTTGGSALASLGPAGVLYVQAIQNALKSASLDLAVLSRPSFAQTLTHTWTASDGTTQTTTHTRAARPGASTPVIAIEARNAIWDSQRRRSAPGSSGTLLRAPLFKVTSA